MSIEFSNPRSSYRNSGWLYFLHSEDSQEDISKKKRPCIIICIGIIDISAAIWFMALIINDVLYHPDTMDRRRAYEQGYFFLSIIGIPIRVLMGVYLLIGLKNENNTKTLYFCRLWMAFQLIFFVASVIDIISVRWLIFSYSPEKWEQATLIITVVIFVYRIASFCLMWAYTKDLQRSQTRTCQQGKEDENSLSGN